MSRMSSPSRPDSVDLTVCALHVAAWRGLDSGMPGGSFASRLLDAMAAADSSNRAKLAAAFPGYAAALMLDSAQLADVCKPRAKGFPRAVSPELSAAFDAILESGVN